MNRILILSIIILNCIFSSVVADTFGTGENQFEIEFVTISGDTNPASGIRFDFGGIFTGVPNDYRIGKYEITNDISLETFIHAVEVQRGKKIPEAEADSLIADAQTIINLLSTE